MQKEYIQSINPKAYINNREITNLDGQYLVKGSKNTLIKNQEKVVTRKGYIVLGDPKTINKGIQSSVDWVTSSNLKRSIRKYDDELEVFYDNEWIRIKNGLRRSSKPEFCSWWSATELIDLLLFVKGDNTINEWSGGITKVASVTSNTITKKGYYSGTSIAFVSGTPATITDSSNGFITAGFVAGQYIVISGSSANSGIFKIKTVTAGTITLVNDEVLTSESSGPTIILKVENAGSWAEERFLTNGTRKVTINDIEYTYSGGETTGTLTGVSPSPVGDVDADDTAIQTIREYTPSDLTGYKADLLSCIYNAVFIGSKTSRKVLISKTSDFADFGYTTPLRIPGEGFELILDNCPTGFAPDEDQMYIGAGRDDFYKIFMELNGAQDGETVVIKKLKTAVGQAPISQGSIVNIKNAIAFLSFEKTIDTLGRVERIEGPQSRPISDDIKDDIESYDITDAHGIYWRRNLYYVLPNEGVMLIYNLQRNHWQPPQIVSFSRLAIIEINGEDRLCAHSSSGNETYLLDEGFNDNGAPIAFNASFGYENFGSRFSLKQFDEIGSELYISRNTIVKSRIVYDYKGSTGIREFDIDGGSNDATIFSPAENYSLGSNPLGSNPLGSGSEVDDMVKKRVIFDTTQLDFFERQRIFYCDKIDDRFEIVAFSENTKLSENIPTYLHK